MRISLLLFLAVALCQASVAQAGQTTIDRLPYELDLTAAAERAEVVAGTIHSHSAQAMSLDTVWLVPYVVDTDDPGGTTTLLSILTQDAEPGDTVRVMVRGHNGSVLQDDFHHLSERGVISLNLRDQPGLPPGGVQHGFVSVFPWDGNPTVSVDYFVVTPDEDFASGGRAVAWDYEKCTNWSSRLLVGGAFSGGTRFTALTNNGHGSHAGAPPTVYGNVYDESGNFVNSFEVRTGDFLIQLDAADLIEPAELFGHVDLVIDGINEFGFLRSETGAEGRYSVGMPGICRDAPE